MNCDAKCVVISRSIEIQASSYIDQTYHTAVSNDHNSQQLKFVYIQDTSKLTKVTKGVQKIELHCNNCAIAGKRQNCAKIALCKITIFWWI